MRWWLILLSPVTTGIGVLPMIARLLAFAVLFGLSVPADAADHPVSSESDLRTAIASAVDGDTITFNADVTLTQDLPAIQTSVTIAGNNRILDGAGTFRGFFVVRFNFPLNDFNVPVNVAIQDLTIRNARARGGAGRSGGGGGAGLGGALFVANAATVTLRNVQLDANGAIGGLGGTNGLFGGGGGGGLGGFAGDNRGGGGGGVGVRASGGTVASARAALRESCWVFQRAATAPAAGLALAAATAAGAVAADRPAALP